jgi:uncharacterized protein (DUF983 family)
MPRRRPPVEIFTMEVPRDLERRRMRCPMCSETNYPGGWVAARLVSRCEKCGIRFTEQALPRQTVRQT